MVIAACCQEIPYRRINHFMSSLKRVHVFLFFAWLLLLQLLVIRVSFVLIYLSLWILEPHLRWSLSSCLCYMSFSALCKWTISDLVFWLSSLLIYQYYIQPVTFLVSLTQFGLIILMVNFLKSSWIDGSFCYQIQFMNVGL